MMAGDYLTELFAVRVLRCDAIVPPADIATLTQHALAVHRDLNPYRVPYSRPDRRSLDVLLPEVFDPVFDAVREKVRIGYDCEVEHIEGRESVLWNGTHLPTHVEKSDLSAILWLDYSAVANPERCDYNGLFVLGNPSGPWGFQSLPWEGSRCQMIEPKPGALVIHPSYIHHFVYPYRADRPGVEIHFEINVRR